MANVFLAPGLATHLRRSIQEGVQLNQTGVKEGPLKDALSKQFADSPLKLWAVKSSLKNVWKQIAREDLLLFYREGKFQYRGEVAFTYPFSESNEQSAEAKGVAEAVWGKDPRDGETWPYLIFLKNVQPTDFPLDHLNKAAGYRLSSVGGFMRCRNPERVIQELKVAKEPLQVASSQPVEHDKMVQYIYELGEIIGYKAEKKWRTEGREYDVVWHRPPREGPRCAFEVQAHGNVESALLKLKHAFDKWGSTVFLVSTFDQIEDVKTKHLTGTLHELVEENALGLVTMEEMSEFLKFKGKYEWLERKFGLKPR